MTDAAFSPNPVSSQDQLLGSAEDVALFLDLDGTLLDIAATPEAVVVPSDLVADLLAVSKTLDGALAIVSGRDLGEIDSLLAPLRLPAAGGHGTTIRLPDGKREEIAATIPEPWIDRLLELQRARPGILIERKSHCVVAHFRSSPFDEEVVRRTTEKLVSQDPEGFELLAGRMVFEIRPRGASKGHAVRRFMRDEPFRGRRPVFVGDDVTDEDGFEAVVELGGIALHVATNFRGEPRHVRRWLKQLAQN